MTPCALVTARCSRCACLKPLLGRAVASGEAAVDGKLESARAAGAAFGVAAPAQKVARSMFLFVHLLVLCFVCGDYFLYSSNVPAGGALCRPARVAAIIFYKPFLVSCLYCLNFLMDAQGWMLFHNPVTDTVVFVLMALMALYLAITAIFAVPVLICFVYLFLAFFVPPVAYSMTTGWATYAIFEKEGKNKVPRVLVAAFDPKVMKWSDGKWKSEWADEATRDEAFAAAVIFKRLSFYSFFAAVVSSVGFWPWYLGDSYVSVLERAVEGMVPSLQFWSPEFRLFFRFPDVAIHLQLSLALSIGAISLEYALLAWALLLERLYPQGWATAFDSALYTPGYKAAAAAALAAASAAALATASAQAHPVKDHEGVGETSEKEAAAPAVEAMGASPPLDKAGALESAGHLASDPGAIPATPTQAESRRKPIPGKRAGRSQTTNKAPSVGVKL